MEKIEHKTVSTNGINMHVASIGSGPVVLFLHGFPELWYTWRHQLLSLSAAGYRAIAPDLRGYGDTDAPPDASSHSILHIVADLVGLLDALGIEPDRVKALVNLSVVFRPRNPKRKPIQSLRAIMGDNYLYVQVSGFTGGLNYYRDMDLTWELTAAWTGVQIKVPVKFIVGDLDITYNTSGVKEYIHNGGFKRDVRFLQELIVMEGVAHFINQERPEEISAHIYDFIKKF
ncbi:Epoxide hydrolase 2 [Glycine soja]|uniref:Epoxide hydrolase 2 n=1 Tax=Glycine soja TaxID=3848 RepID=A0A0B2QKY9_GLYSO|nr:Epoxide hydrolase 2 [Glycine soja]